MVFYMVENQLNSVYVLELWKEDHSSSSINWTWKEGSATILSTEVTSTKEFRDLYFLSTCATMITQRCIY